MKKINYEKGIVETGDGSRIKEVLRRAQRGGELTLGFLGGSITQGAAATAPEL